MEAGDVSGKKLHSDTEESPERHQAAEPEKIV